MSIVRVEYRERQRLTAADLRTEQDYRLALAGRHHVGPHEWGVVRGLYVMEPRGPSTAFTLMPGVAIDGYGREILVPEPHELTGVTPEDCCYVWLYYCEAGEQIPRGRVCKDDPAPRVAQLYCQN